MPHEGAANWPHGGRTQHTASPWLHLVDVVVGGLDVNLALCSMGRVAGGVSGRAHCGGIAARTGAMLEPSSRPPQSVRAWHPSPPESSRGQRQRGLHRGT